MSYPKNEEEFVNIIKDTFVNSIFKEGMTKLEIILTKKMKDQYRAVLRISLANDILIYTVAIYQKKPDEMVLTKLNDENAQTMVYQVYKGKSDVEAQINALAKKMDLPTDIIKNLIIEALFSTLSKNNLSLEELIHKGDLINEKS